MEVNNNGPCTGVKIDTLGESGRQVSNTLDSGEFSIT